MALSDLLPQVARILDRLGVEYFVKGSVASMSYGKARLTNDVDIVVRLTTPQAGRLVREFPESEFYVSAEAARDAACRESASTPHTSNIGPTASAQWESIRTD